VLPRHLVVGLAILAICVASDGISESNSISGAQLESTPGSAWISSMPNRRVSRSTATRPVDVTNISDSTVPEQELFSEHEGSVDVSGVNSDVDPTKIAGFANNHESGATYVEPTAAPTAQPTTAPPTPSASPPEEPPVPVTRLGPIIVASPQNDTLKPPVDQTLPTMPRHIAPNATEPPIPVAPPTASPTVAQNHTLNASAVENTTTPVAAPSEAGHKVSIQDHKLILPTDPPSPPASSSSGTGQAGQGAAAAAAGGSGSGSKAKDWEIPPTDNVDEQIEHKVEEALGNHSTSPQMPAPVSSSVSEEEANIPKGQRPAFEAAVAKEVDRVLSHRRNRRKQHGSSRRGRRLRSRKRMAATLQHDARVAPVMPPMPAKAGKATGKKSAPIDGALVTKLVAAALARAKITPAAPEAEAPAAASTALEANPDGVVQETMPPAQRSWQPDIRVQQLEDEDFASVHPDQSNKVLMWGKY